MTLEQDKVVVWEHIARLHGALATEMQGKTAVFVPLTDGTMLTVDFSQAITAAIQTELGIVKNGIEAAQSKADLKRLGDDARDAIEFLVNDFIARSGGKAQVVLGEPVTQKVRFVNGLIIRE